MNLYEFITPSDPITFRANNDKTAYVCAVVVGQAKAGCHRIIKGGEPKNLNTILFLDSKAEETLFNFLGMKLQFFVAENKAAVREALSSFAYTTPQGREAYELELKAMESAEHKNEFRIKHEDKTRTSLNGWVKQAWQMSNQLKDKNVKKGS